MKVFAKEMLQMFQRTEELSIADILTPLQDGDRVASTLANVGFDVNYFFNPTSYKI